MKALHEQKNLLHHTYVYVEARVDIRWLPLSLYLWFLVIESLAKPGAYQLFRQAGQQSQE